MYLLPQIKKKCARLAWPAWAILLVLLFSSPTRAEAKWPPDGLTLHQIFQQETAYRVAAEPIVTKLLTYYQLEALYRYSADIQVTAIGRLSYEPIYDLQNLTRTNPFQDRFIESTPTKIEQTDAFDAVVRELYSDFYFDKFDVRIGKQIVRWGVIDGFRITDELNPIDFNEFILRDLTDRYIPLWMLKVDRYFEGFALQMLWIPQLEFHRPAPRGTEFEQFQMPPRLIEPAKTFKNTELGLRLSGYFKGFDLALTYFDGWDDFPTASQTIFGFGGGSRGADDEPTRYHRIRTFGLAFTKNIGNELVKGEFAAVQGRSFGTFSTASQKEIARPQLKYAVGWDTRAPLGVETFLQFSQTFIIKHREEIIADKVDTGASVTFRKKLMNESWLLKLLVIYIANDDEVLMRPNVSYRWSDPLTLSFGADIFYGKEGNIQQDDFRFIGFFDKNDRLTFNARYSF